MKLYKKEAKIYKDTIFLIPTIELDFDVPIYMCHNFAIVVHWLVFHARLLWMEE